MTQVMIVGNGEIDPRYATTIETADLIVRFNDCRSSTSSGLRTDVVAVCNTGRPAKIMLESNAWRSHPAVMKAKEIWCVRDPRKFAALRPVLAVQHPELDDFCDDGTPEFQAFCGATGKKCIVIDERIHDWVDDALHLYHPSPYVVPSSGMIVIASVLDQFPGARITIVGFGHEGWELHPFAAEKRLVEDYVSLGKLRRLEGRHAFRPSTTLVAAGPTEFTST